jgi:ATP-binding cassette subfamily B protein
MVAAAPPVPLGQVFRRFWPDARPYRRWLALSFVFVILGPAIQAAEIYIFKLVIDDVLVPRHFGPFLWIALGYLGLTIVGGIVDFFDDYLSTWVGERFLLELRTGFFRHLQGLSLDFFERRRLGDVISRLTGDISSIEDLVLSGVVDGCSYVIRLVVFAGALFFLRWDMALASLVVGPLFGFAARRFSRLIKQASRERRRRSGSISAVAEESLGNTMLVQAYNRQDTEAERFRRESVGSFAATMASTRLKALFGPLIDVIELLGAMVVLGMGVWELTAGRLSLGGLLVFLTYLSQLYSPIRGLSRLTNSFYSASAAAERIIEFLDQRPSVVERANARRIGRARGAVEFSGVGFRYPEGERDAISDVSFSVSPGETLALVGPSGAGKSTIAKLLLRLYDPTAGRIELDGVDLSALQIQSLRENIAVLLQETLVFDGTVRENIAYGLPGATEGDIVAAAVQADADEFIRALPEGYDTPVGQRGRRLSGGQRQRLAVARALVRDAPVLILDEPTTALDPGSGRRILEPLRRLMDGRATIVISHNLLTVQEASSIVYLDGGAITERGTHAELAAAGGSYARLFSLHEPELDLSAKVAQTALR